MRKKFKTFLKLNWFLFFYYNFMCRRIQRDAKCYLLPYRGAVIEFDKTAHIILHSHLILNGNKLKGSRAEAFLRLRAGASLEVNGDVQLYYGATIEVHKNAALAMGKILINTGAVIICAYKMTIGNGVLVSRQVLIMDSDHHHIFNAAGEKTNPPKEVIIEDNVWLGVKATVLRGVTIGHGCIVSPSTLVIRKAKPQTLVAGVPAPARSLVEVHWKV